MDSSIPRFDASRPSSQRKKHSVPQFVFSSNMETETRDCSQEVAPSGRTREKNTGETSRSKRPSLISDAFKHIAFGSVCLNRTCFFSLVMFRSSFLESLRDAESGGSREEGRENLFYS